MKTLLLLVCILGLSLAAETTTSSNTKLFVFTEECYNSLIVKQEFGNADCIKLTLSKCIGLAIVTFAAILKVPQIMKILKASSTEGLLFSSFFTELIMFTITIAYNVNQQNPFNLYGESVFISIQNILIMCMFFVYDKSTSRPLMFAQFGVFAVLAVVAALQLIPADIFSYSMYINMVLVAVARVPQIINNFKNGSTGQLAAITLFLNFAGAAARLMTVLTEAADDKLSITMTLESVVLNGILFLQVIMYWNSGKKTTPTPQEKQKSPLRKKRE